MNGWVYDGFNSTYARMGVDFEKLYYESDTYLLGKEEVMKGVERESSSKNRMDLFGLTLLPMDLIKKFCCGLMERRFT